MEALQSPPKSPPVVHEGLDGILVARTQLSEVDGERGELLVAGHPIEALAGSVSFEAVCGLLWDGALPSVEHRAELERQLGLARACAVPLVQRAIASMAGEPAMNVLRAALSGLPEAATRFDVVATAGIVLVALARARRSALLAEPDPARPHAEDLLRLLSGAEPTRARAAALDAYLVTVADHGLNASTFAVRVVASTGSDLVSAVTAGVGALKGPLHGGAPGPVLDMLDAIGEVARARSWLAERLAAHERIMGMGHRVYRVRDPRAFVLERALAELERAARPERLAMARAVEAAATDLLDERYPERRLRANVEFYTAVLLEALAIPRELFSVAFAAARSAGWCAHFAEQRASGRLIRPSALYVGPRPS
ncbi:MAG TPA: citrate synthase [Polyangiaceae bacterium]|nr:citrate synthase [Polyangiaceae bacterium]